MSVCEIKKYLVHKLHLNNRSFLLYRTSVYFIFCNQPATLFLGLCTLISRRLDTVRRGGGVYYMLPFLPRRLRKSGEWLCTLLQNRKYNWKCCCRRVTNRSHGKNAYISRKTRKLDTFYTWGCNEIVYTYVVIRQSGSDRLQVSGFKMTPLPVRQSPTGPDLSLPNWSWMGWM